MYLEIPAKPCHTGLTKPPLLAVRVQDDLHGLYADVSGVHLPYLSGKERNTMHFSLNGVVGDHAYGKFNENSDGSLKGKIVILADLNEMPIPSGFNQVDTWFRLSAQKSESGTVQRSLPIGQATIVAPVGTPVPENVNVIYYEGAMDARDEAVKQYFLSRGVEQKKINFRSWSDYHENDARLWARQTANALYGADAASIHCDTHDCSMDSYLERCGIKGLMEVISKERLMQDDEGGQVLVIDVIRSRVSKHLDTLQTFLQSDPLDIERSRPHYEHQIKALKESLEQAEILSQQWEAKARVDEMRSLANDLQALPGSGAFYLTRPHATHYDAVSSETLASALLNGDLLKTQQVWRQGMHEQWQALPESAVGRSKNACWFQFRQEPSVPALSSEPAAVDTRTAGICRFLVSSGLTEKSPNPAHGCKP